MEMLSGGVSKRFLIAAAVLVSCSGVAARQLPAPAAPTNLRVIHASTVGVWPPVPPADPTPTEIALMKAGAGYPERRVYKSAQWHDSLTQEIDNMRHLHVEVAHPEVVRAGIVRLDMFARLFHFQGGTFEGIRKLVRRTNTPVPAWMPTYIPGAEPGRRRELIPDGSAGHDVEFWTPIYLDLGQVTVFDFYTFEIDVVVKRPDGLNGVARIIWKMWVDPDGTHKPDQRRMMTHGEGWAINPANEVNQFGYMIVTMFGAREYESDGSSTITLQSQAKAGRTVTVLLSKNPDLHQHPANYGQILYQQTFVAGDRAFEKIIIPHPPMVVGDRLMARIVDASNPDLGSGATLAVVKLAKN